ncbi:PH domain-containing protein [Sporosarcina soli]|uniref:PH domain-containing protein n=1 Tax=Sporosarcina soli TaxID=334736 RepID=A0ABW0TIB4_9BACL
MTKKRRYSPLVMLFEFGKLGKNSFFFVVFLYVIKADSTSLFITYGRIIFLLVFVLTVFSIIYQWFTHQYELDDKSFHLYKGLFNKSERIIPFSKIQNINRRAPLFHRIFNMTSIHFETGMIGDNAAVTFKVISQKEAERIETFLKSATKHNEVYPNDGFDEPPVEVGHHAPNRIIHFQSTRKDIFKASFTSLSFLILIPFIGSFYFKTNEIFDVRHTAEGLFERMISTSWAVTITVIVLTIASVAFGIVKTFLKYGNYEISSDSDYIYISKGVIDETAFSISKERVQAIEIEQSLLRRWFGLAGVKLTSLGSLSSGEHKLEVNTLYPFLPVHKAYAMIADILPSYAITKEMTRLPKKVFWLRMLWPSWFWLIVTGFLLYFKPTILKLEQAWLILSVVLLFWILGVRWLDFLHTRYRMNKHFMQFKKGVLKTSLFISKREKVIEVNVTRNLVQKRLGLASIRTINRGKPIRHAGVDDVPIEFANAFVKWYKDRENEVTVE